MVLFLVFCVHADGHGPVVEQFHLHVSAKLSCADRLAESLLQHFTETLIEGDGDGVGRKL